VVPMPRVTLAPSVTSCGKKERMVDGGRGMARDAVVTGRRASAWQQGTEQARRSGSDAALDGRSP
jgi:hypothetical protein